MAHAVGTEPRLPYLALPGDGEPNTRVSCAHAHGGGGRVSWCPSAWRDTPAGAHLPRSQPSNGAGNAGMGRLLPRRSPAASMVHGPLAVPRRSAITRERCVGGSGAVWALASAIAFRWEAAARCCVRAHWAGDATGARRGALGRAVCRICPAPDGMGRGDETTAAAWAKDSERRRRLC